MTCVSASPRFDLSPTESYRDVIDVRVLRLCRRNFTPDGAIASVIQPSNSSQPLYLRSTPAASDQGPWPRGLSPDGLNRLPWSWTAWSSRRCRALPIERMRIAQKKEEMLIPFSHYLFFMVLPQIFLLTHILISVQINSQRLLMQYGIR